ncbi:MAG: hypothetical protein Q7S12_04370 [bacterium]|nr:hypothetical protein [bacterium]
MQQTLVGFVLMTFGGIMAIRPDIMMRFQIWTNRVIMGARYEPSERTYKITRFFGAFFIVLGLLVITGAMQ